MLRLLLYLVALFFGGVGIMTVARALGTAASSGGEAYDLGFLVGQLFVAAVALFIASKALKAAR